MDGNQGYIKYQFYWLILTLPEVTVRGVSGVRPSGHCLANPNQETIYLTRVLSSHAEMSSGESRGFDCLFQGMPKEHLENRNC